MHIGCYAQWLIGIPHCRTVVNNWYTTLPDNISQWLIGVAHSRISVHCGKLFYTTLPDVSTQWQIVIHSGALPDVAESSKLLYHIAG